MPVRDRAAFFPADGPPVSLPFRTLVVRPAATFVKEFDEVLEADGVEVKWVGPRAPNLNVYAERWVQSTKARRSRFRRPKARLGKSPRTRGTYP